MRNIIGLIIISLFAGCTPKPLSVDEIIDKTIETYGGSKVFNSLIEFDFRDKHYTAKYDNQRFSLKRIFTDSTGNIIDELRNDGFVRLHNNEPVTLDEEWTGKYSRSVNSVIYFFRIPFVLKDAAVKPALIGEGSIRDKSYYKIRIRFSETGGGDDFDDEFVYWINKESYVIEYFAYSYSTSGGGRRFREMINPRTINGLLVVDYINYQPIDLEVPIDTYDNYFMEGGLEELSRIENRNITIEYLE